MDCGVEFAQREVVQTDAKRIRGRSSASVKNVAVKYFSNECNREKMFNNTLPNYLPISIFLFRGISLSNAIDMFVLFTMFTSGITVKVSHYSITIT